MNQDPKKTINDSATNVEDDFSGNEPEANKDGVGTPPENNPVDAAQTEDERTGEGTGARAGEYS